MPAARVETIDVPASIGPAVIAAARRRGSTCARRVRGGGRPRRDDRGVRGLDPFVVVLVRGAVVVEAVAAMVDAVPKWAGESRGVVLVQRALEPHGRATVA